MNTIAINTASESSKKIGIWLLICALTVYLMIIVGGATRLTQSGLSMVEWEPIMGTIPPLSLTDWQDTFNKYQQSPEYLKINKGMSLEEFKSIFWWEYGHRVLGRFIGMLFFIPFVFFLIRGYLSRPWKFKLFGLFLLGGVQAVVGWYMVKSGLVNDPHVSQYRLASHFGIALLIYIVMIWFMLDFFKSQQRRSSSISLKTTSLLVTKLVFFMMITGAFVAGLKAGHIYNTFPQMGDSFVPQGLFSITPAWKNLFENPATVQFIHRCTAYIIVLSVVILFLKGLKTDRLYPELKIKSYLIAVLILMFLQVSIGITTLVNKVPVLWGVLHQFTGVALLTSLIFLTHKLSRDY